MVWYMLGDLAAVEQLDPAQAAESNARVQLHALLAAGRPKDAVQQAAAGRLLDDPWNALAVSLSFDLAGDRPEADKWREKACAGLERLDMGDKRAADLLRGQGAAALGPRTDRGGRQGKVAAGGRVGHALPEPANGTRRAGSPPERQPPAALPPGAKGPPRRPLEVARP